MTTDAQNAAGAAGNPATPDPAAAAAAAGAGAGDTKPAGASGDALPAGQAPESGGGASAAYRPEGLPDHLYGKTDLETIEKLYAAYKPAREAISKFGSVPDAPEKYTFTPAEAVAPYLPDVANDPVMKVAQQAAHKHGLGDKQFAGFVNEFMAGLVGGEMLDEPFSAEKERAIIAGDVADPQERAKKAGQMANDTIAFLDALAAQGRIPKETADWGKGRTDRGHFIKLVSVLRQAAPGVETGGQPSPAGVTLDQIKARQASPKNTWGHPDYDAAYAAETDRLYREVVGKGESRA